MKTANTPILIWKSIARVTFTARQCSEGILGGERPFSSVPHLMAGCTQCYIASRVVPMEASRTRESHLIVQETCTARQLRAAQVAVKVAAASFTNSQTPAEAGPRQWFMRLPVAMMVPGPARGSQWIGAVTSMQ